MTQSTIVDPGVPGSDTLGGQGVQQGGGGHVGHMWGYFSQYPLFPLSPVCVYVRAHINTHLHIYTSAITLYTHFYKYTPHLPSVSYRMFLSHPPSRPHPAAWKSTGSWPPPYCGVTTPSVEVLSYHLVSCYASPSFWLPDRWNFPLRVCHL